MKITKRIHPGYQEFEKAKAELGLKGIGTSLSQLFGKYQYLYSTDKGEISLVLLKNYLRDSRDFWEICCLSGNLFEDVERFSTKKEAEKRIFELNGLDKNEECIAETT